MSDLNQMGLHPSRSKQGSVLHVAMMLGLLTTPSQRRRNSL